MREIMSKSYAVQRAFYCQVTLLAGTNFGFFALAIAREGLCRSQEISQTMRKLLLAAGLAAAALIPSLASAQSCEHQRDNQVVGTVAGAGLGALLGSAIAPRGDRTAGAIIGGVGGAVVGNQVTRPYADCTHAYGYYDRNSQWHANAIERADARGYYDRDGAWVDGAPNGYYDTGGRWIAAAATPADGYYDTRGRWIPASADGYYDDGGQWVASASGYYASDGRWIAGQATGAYDANGRWTAGARSGHADANGVWVADSQLGYYDTDHHWRAGPARGYYDTRGVWIGAPSVDSYGVRASYEGDVGRYHGDVSRYIDAREAWLEQRIRMAADSGDLSRHAASNGLDRLNSIRRQESGMRDGEGRLAPQDEHRLQARLDDLSAALGLPAYRASD